MKQTMKTSRIGAVAATLGMALALGGTSYAVAQTGTDIGLRGASVASEPAGISPVIGKSWVRWAQSPDPAQQTSLPAAAPLYSQVNFQSNPLDSGGVIQTSQIGQMHAEASVLLRKSSGSPAEVTCDLRMSGLAASNEYVTTILGSGNTRLTMPLVGSRTDVSAGPHNVGIRCWATGNTVVMEKADLHAVVYGASVPG